MWFQMNLIFKTENIFFQPENKTTIQSNYSQCFWVGSVSSYVVKITENTVLTPESPSLCNQELNSTATFTYNVTVNDKTYETAVEIDPRRVIAKDGKYMSFDQSLSRYLAREWLIGMPTLNEIKAGENFSKGVPKYRFQNFFIITLKTKGAKRNFFLPPALT